MRLLITLFCLISVIFSNACYSNNKKEMLGKTEPMLQSLEERSLKAIIFDIGNVFVKVDLELWAPAFKKIGVNLPHGFLEDKKLSQLVYDYSEGKINTPNFIAGVSNTLRIKKIPFDQFKFAWNYVIRSLDIDAITAIQDFRLQHYKIYSLSDTNDMHTDYINELYRQNFPNKSFYSLFDKNYLSQKTGYRKVAESAWLHILKEQNLKPEECLFVDDKIENIQIAKKLGLHVFHYDTNGNMKLVLEMASKINSHLNMH